MTNLYCVKFDTPIGEMLLAGTETHLCISDFVDRENLHGDIERVIQKFELRQQWHETILLKKSIQQLNEYFANKRKHFDLPLQWAGTVFQKKVWVCLQTIKLGLTASYKDIATKIGNAGAYRAVARANAANHLSIIVPCHRVIHDKGSLSGYAGGVHRKSWLLKHEATMLQ